MFKLEEVIQLKDDEEIRMVTKRHAITIVPMLFLAFLLIVLPFFFLFPLFSTGPTGVVAFLAIVLVGALVAWRTFAMWDGDALIISNLRIIKVTQTGIFSRTVNELAAENISEVSWGKKGIFSHLFNYGTIRSGNSELSEARYIPNPKDAHALIIEIIDLARKREKKEPDHEARVERVQKLVEDLDDCTLLKIERGLKDGEREDTIKELFGSGESGVGSGDEDEDEEEEEEDDEDEKDIAVKDVSEGGLKPLDD